MDRECVACGMEKSRHWGAHKYDEFDLDAWVDSHAEPVEIKTSKPHPRPSHEAWQEFIDSARRTTIDPMDAEAQDEIEEVKAEKAHGKPSRRHTEASFDGTDYVCNACGSVSADFDLFEEVGAEVNCKSVEEAEPNDVEAVPETTTGIHPTPVAPKTFVRKPVKTEMSREIMDMYKKMLDDITREEKKRRAYKMPEWPSRMTWTPGGYSIDEHVEKTVESKSKSYSELAKEFRTASENPENQKKWYSEVQREMQRRERRR